MIWPLVGRDGELGFVSGLLSGGSAGGVVVAGPAGVGKTRLAAEAGRVAEAQGRAVEWVRATRSAASIPLGAFAGLLPPGPPDGAALLALARQALVERAAGRGLVLCVDDAHLLDPGSAALVHQLVAAGEAFAVVTVRSDERTPDAVRALWKDELCAFVELDALSQPAVEALLAGVLGGPLDGRSATALWELTQGNVLFLRELVLLGTARGVLAEHGGIWRWDGDVATGMRLAELVEARLGGLADADRAVLELVAVGSPLAVALLESDELVSLEELERGDLVESRLDGRRRIVDVAHPLHGEVIRANVARTRQEAIQRRLIDAVEGHGVRRRADVVRLAGWRLESGGGDRELFEQAARHALSARDAEVAERFARAALQAGGGFAARLTLGQALAGAGRADEAETVLAGLEHEAAGDGERAAAAIAIARNRFWALGRAADAEEVLRRAEQAVSDEGPRDELVGTRIRVLSGTGRPLEALEIARRLLADESVREQARLLAAIAAADALVMCGRTGEAVALIEEWIPVGDRYRSELPMAEIVLPSMRGVGLRLAGRLREAIGSSREVYALALGRRSVYPAAVEAALLGFVWLATGRVQTALRWCREGAALLRGVDAVGMLPLALAGIAQAAAQAGQADVAREAVAEMDRTPLGHGGFEPELGLAHAWTAAAGGELSRARALALEAAGLAGARDHAAFEVRALHELCRLGDPATAAPRLARLAGDEAGAAAPVDGPFAAVAAAHAAALVARDPAALSEVADRFEALDALLAAAEAADAAAAAYREAGRDASARAAAARAAQWLKACEDARPPTLLGDLAAAELTVREREIALLAAGGLSSREIADRLVVSVRTVDNHLQRAYRKLGIARREDLSRLL